MSTIPTRPPRHLLWLALAGLLASMFFVAGSPTPAHAATSTTISANGGSGGRTFDGIGAISGGGGNSRLLRDYPAAQQSQILDYLFKPGYGADLQMLKLEIGGDANSTDGSEPSIEHTRGVVNCDAGYEFWLAQQAKARNPTIAFYGLAWAAPGWINGGFWSTDTINYLISWLGCAKADGVPVSYLGGWNERGYDANWYINLRTALNNAGYGSVKIVADDSGWDAADAAASNSAFNNAVSIWGAHYSCNGGDGGNADTCSSDAAAQANGKPLWDSEQGSQDMNTGAPALIRAITRGYLDAKMVSYFNWPLIAAIYPNLPYATVGLMTAGSPWSGAYSVGADTWATAQVTQFTQPGWKFLDAGSGYLGGAESDGTYVTLKSTNNTDYTTIVETTTASAAQNVTINVSGGLSTGTAHVWATNLNNPGTATDLIHTQDVTPSNGSYTLTVQPGYVYSITTTTGQGKGSATSPANAALALPYSDSFESTATNTEARYLSDMQGSFEARPCTDGRSGQCVQQVTPVKPIEWQNDSDAFSLLGDPTWSNYTVKVDVDLRQSGTAELLGRAGTQSRPQGNQNLYKFRVSDTGAWSIVKNYSSGTATTLASGTTTALGTGRWHTLGLTFQGTQITATLDGGTLSTVNDSTFLSGQVGVGVVGYQTDEFDNLTITPGSGTAQPPTGPITSGIAGKCLDDDGGSTVNGTKAQIWDCNNTGAQQWTYNGGALQVNGKCLDVTGMGTANGTLAEIWDCNGGSNQQWELVGNTLVNPASGRCLDDPGFTTVNGTQAEIWDCNGGSNQQWTLPSA